MTPTPKRTVICAVAGILFSVLLATAYPKETRDEIATPLGIEIALKKPFYVLAGKTTKIFIRVPVSDLAPGEEGISAIKLEPRMEAGKLRVTLFVIKGEPDDVRTCTDWNRLSATPVGSYLAGLDEEVALVKLREFGVTMGNDPLTFRVVPKRALSPVPPQFGSVGNGCECSSCGQSNCCPNPDMCLECGSCGYVCCDPNQ